MQLRWHEWAVPGAAEMPTMCTQYVPSSDFVWNTFPALQQVSGMEMILHGLCAYIRVGTARI